MDDEAGYVSESHASISVIEFTTLILLMKKAEARSLFEFGTYKGISVTSVRLESPC